MKSKVISVILAAAMVLSMVACSGNNGSTTEKAATEKTTTAATTATEAKAQATTAAVSETAATTEKAAGTEKTTAAASASTDGVDMSNLKGLTIGFSQCDNSNSWRIAETQSMQDTAKQYGINLVYTDASGDIAKQASDIQDMVAQKVDFIVVAPQEEDGLQAALKSAMDAGIGVILVDRTINGEAGKFYNTAIMSDFVWEAQQVADRVIKETGGKGNVVILQGTQGATATNDRQKGFTEAIKGTELNVVADQVANYVMAEGQSVMENILQAQGKDIKVVFAHNDDMALGAITAIKAAGYVPGKDILVASVDGSAAAMEAILAGELLTTCSCSPKFGPIAFSTVAKLKAGETVPESIKNEDVLYDITNADVSKGF